MVAVSASKSDNILPRNRKPPNRGLAILFLNALREGASVSGAARIAQKPCCSFYNWRRRYPSFEKEWDDAVGEGTDLLEDEAVRRGVVGIEKPVFYGGKLVGHEIRHSDTLLMFLLKGRRPEKFDPARSLSENNSSPQEDAAAFKHRISKILSDISPPIHPDNNQIKDKKP